MATETLFKYRHKKFDKHNRESKLEPSIVAINLVTIPKASAPKEIPELAFPKASTPKAIPELAFPPQEKFKAELNEIPVKTEHMSLKASISPLYDPKIAASPAKRRKLKSNGPIDRKIHIKIEPKSPSHQVEEPLCDNEYAVQIKQELIELNTNVPKIPQEAYEEICKFRGNMVRKFPKKERSAKEQERRDKNTFACRRSRRVKKIEQVAVEEEYKGYKDTHLRLTEYAIRAAAYFKELMNRTEEEMSDIIVVD